MYFPQIFSLNLYEILPVFRRLFGSEERKRLTLELYNAINQTDYDNPGTGVAKGRALGEDRLASLSPLLYPRKPCGVSNNACNLNAVSAGLLLFSHFNFGLYPEIRTPLYFHSTLQNVICPVSRKTNEHDDSVVPNSPADKDGIIHLSNQKYENNRQKGHRND